jgi:sugar phosphate isomerase/epimerase
MSEGGTLMFDQLLNGTNPELMDIQLDLYWVVYAGHDPMEWMRKMGSRVTSLHVKDIGTDRKSVEVGEGKIDFSTIFAMPEASNVKYYIVELEHYKRTPIEGIEVSYHNLKRLLNT